MPMPKTKAMVVDEALQGYVMIVCDLLKAP